MANGTAEPQAPAGEGIVPNSPQIGYSTVWYGVAHKVGLGSPKFSTIDVGPIGASIVVQAGREKEGLEYLAQAVVNPIMDIEREKAIEKIKAAGGYVNT